MLKFQSTMAQNNFNELNDIVAQTEKVYKTEAVLSVANKDTIIFVKDSKAFSALRGQAPIGYSSQWLTAALVMAMVDEGKISLDDKVSRYIPIFGKYYKNYITIRHCLSHFTGIQAETTKALKIFEKKKFASLEEEVDEYAKKHIQNNAGEAFRYNEIGPNIAGRILEIVTKKKFDMLAQQKLFRPLGMRQTTFSNIDMSAINPSTGAKSTANDYLRFLTMLLNNGVYKGQRILSEKSVAELRKIYTNPQQIQYSPEETKGLNYAAGAWAVEQNELKKEADALTAPSFGGTTPYIDFCKGYAFILLMKTLDNDQTTKGYQDIKAVLDKQFNGSCN